MSTTDQYNVSYEYTPSLVRQAFLAYFWRRYTVHIIATPVLLFLCIEYFFSPAYGPLAGMGIGIITMFWSSWLGAFRLSGRTAQSASTLTIAVAFSEENLTFLSPDVSSTVKWSAIASVYRTRKFLIVLRKGVLNPVPIPLTALSEAAISFFQARVKEAGGMVR